MNRRRAPSCTPWLVSSPLWSRAPSRDENGAPYIDFMMIIPGLKQGGDVAVEGCLQRLRASLDPFGQAVAYVDLNVKLNLLWISARPAPGILRQIARSIRQEIPEARIVAGDFNPESFAERKQPWLVRLGRRISIRLGVDRPRLPSGD